MTRVDAALRECGHCGGLLEHPEASGTVRCLACGAEARFLLFPALSRRGAIISASNTVAQQDESSCFFHESRRAAAACDSCGRFVCELCRIEWGSRMLCPSCITVAEKNTDLLTRSRPLYDSIALAVAIASIPLFTLSFFTAPIAIVCAVLALKKPGSLVRGTALRAWAAIVLAVALLAGWAWFIAYVVLKSKV